MFTRAGAGWRSSGSALASVPAYQIALLTPALDLPMIRFKAAPPAEKPAATAAAKSAKPAPKTKAAKTPAGEDLLDLATEAKDDKD